MTTIFICWPIGVFFYKATVPSVPLLSVQIVLPPHLDNVRDKLAENIHELWGMNKIELGWTYGKVKLSSVTFSAQKHTGCICRGRVAKVNLRSFQQKAG